MGYAPRVLWTAFKTTAVIFVMCLLVPLVVWMGSGSPRQAWYAFREYMKIMVGAFVLIGGLALLATLVEFIG
jgi:hypothetical protein